MHKLNSAFVLGYHGCDASVAENVLAGDQFIPSTNVYDWLGHGIYFWEANPRRGLDFARELMKQPRSASKVANPGVVGAVIDLGLCLDLTTAAGIEYIRVAHDAFLEIYNKADALRQLPANSKDGLRRNLDCAVVNTLHKLRQAGGEPSFDTVKGIFIEGAEVYPGSGFRGENARSDLRMQP